MSSTSHPKPIESGFVAPSVPPGRCKSRRGKEIQGLFKCGRIARTTRSEVSCLALQERHTQTHQVVEGVPMHHVLAAIHDVEIDLWV